MSIPLDDLLPTNDECFEPVDSGEFFKTGSPFWEWSDQHKWIIPTGRDDRRMFRWGWEAANFETLLKSGLSFSFMAMELPRHAMEARAKQFGRGFRECGSTDLYRIYVVSGHRDGLYDATNTSE